MVETATIGGDIGGDFEFTRASDSEGDNARRPRIVSVRNVTRRFDQTFAARGVCFDVRAGEVFALLGPNGAGKTTMANLLLGNQHPDEGEIRFHADGETSSSLAPSQVGYFPGDSSVYKSLPISRMLVHAGTRQGMAPAEAQAATELWLERMELSHRADTALGNLSRGNQQKVQFAEAVLHRPRIVFLDEPFASLDPVNQELFVAMIRELQREGITVLISDHQMPLIERLADYICILNHGRVIAQGTLEDLRGSANAGTRVRVRLADPRAAVDMEALSGLSAIQSVERTAGGEIRLMTTRAAAPVEVMNFAKTYLRVSEILAEPASLHDIYIQCIRNDAATREKGNVNNWRDIA
jgi:ABC-2 type transport system ATP-binding protein